MRAAIPRRRTRRMRRARLHPDRAAGRDVDHRHPGDDGAGAVPEQRRSTRGRAVLKEDLFRMRDAIDQYYADKGQYPSTLDALVSDGYLRKLPEDPFTKSSTHLADRAGRARSEQSHRGSRRLRRQERLGRHRARRHQVRRLGLDGGQCVSYNRRHALDSAGPARRPRHRLRVSRAVRPDACRRAAEHGPGLDPAGRRDPA